MICPNCQSEIFDDSRFCKECCQPTTPLVNDAGDVLLSSPAPSRRKPAASRERQGASLTHRISRAMWTAVVVVVLVVGACSPSLVFRTGRLRTFRVAGIEKSLDLARRAIRGMSGGARLVLFVLATYVGVIAVAKLANGIHDRSVFGRVPLLCGAVGLLVCILFGLFCTRLQALTFAIQGQGLSYVVNVICFGLGTVLGVVTKTFQG